MGWVINMPLAKSLFRQSKITAKTMGFNSAAKGIQNMWYLMRVASYALMTNYI